MKEKRPLSTLYFQSTCRGIFGTLFLLICLGASLMTKAQNCVGPYMMFESFNSAATAGWLNSVQSYNTTSSNSGRYSVVLSTTAHYITTPSLTKAGNLTFYFRSIVAGSAFSVDYSTNQNATYPGASWTNLTTVSNAAAVSTWTQSATIAVPANVYVRITLTAAKAVFFDDIAYTSTNGATAATDNIIIVPKTGVTATCTQTITSGIDYLFYDNGGSSDTYSTSQNNTIKFVPQSGYQTQLEFVNYNNAGVVGYGMTFTDSDNPLSGYTGTAYPGSPSASLLYTSTNTTDYSVTVNYTSTTTTPAAGFLIKVRCIPITVTCGTLPSVAIASYTYQSVALGWTAPATAPSGGYDYYVTTTSSPTLPGTTSSLPASSGTTLLTGNSSSATGTTVTGLAGNTTYYVWIRSNCGSVNAVWQSAGSFTTYCSPVSVTYTENFNGLSGPLPVCTSAVTSANATSSAWATNLGTGTVYCNQATTMFITKPIQLTGGTTYRLTYDYLSNNGTADFKVYYGTTSGTPNYTNLTSLLYTHTGISAASSNLIDFTPGTSGVYYIGFSVESLQTPSTTIFNLDNVVVDLESCGIPALSATVTGVSVSAGTIAWTPPSSAPTGGYQYYLMTTNTPPTYSSVPTGTIAAGSTSYALSGLTSGTTYYVWIRSNCSSGVYGSWSTVASFTTLNNYCVSTSTSSSAYFNSFTTSGGTTNINNLSSGYSASGYGNFTATQAVTQVQNGSVSFTTAITGVGGGVGVAIFVDWNQNGVFTDAGEMVYNTNGTYAFSNPSGSFTVPLTALAGTTRMRIVTNYNSSTPVSCNTGITGETEDYTFVVTALTPCSGFPAASTVTVSTAPCNSTNFTLSLGTTYTNTGITYQWQSATNLAFTAGITNLGTASTQVTSQTGTKYYRCLITCSGNTTTSSILTVTTTNCYCASTSSSSSAYFNSFATTGGSTNVSNASSGYSASGYGDFTASQTVTQVQNASVSFTTSITGVGGGVGVAIFVDWNQNGVFTDAGETVYSTNGTYVFSNPSGSFTVPLTALAGTTRMRIVTNYNSSTPVSCNSGITGETEDYTFVVVALTPCSGFPAASTVTVSTTPCNGINFTLSLGTTYANSGLTYQWQSATDAAFTLGVTTLGTASTQVTNQTGTKYYRCLISCGANTTTSSVLPITTSNCYCTSTSSSGSYYFTSFSTTGGSTNIANSTGYAASGYGDYTASQTVTQTQSGSVSFATAISGISFGVGVSIFVDWNQNGVFTDAGEQVYSTNGIYAYTNPTGSFSVPSTALPGATRMRIVCNYYNSTPLSCNSGITGETEDYTFVVSTLPCSGNPTSIAITITSLSTATIHWTAASPAPANGYQYYLSTSNTTPTAATTPTGSTAAGVTTVSLTGLTSSTNYYLWVRSNCGGGLGQGVWVGVTSFYQPNCAVGGGTGTTTLGCPSVVSGGLGLSGADPAPIAGCSASGCVDLEATYLPMGQTTSYTVQSIPYAPPYQFKCLQNPVNVSVDDIWSQTINLPFNFCFYGNNYNKCLIGSNGVLTFDTVNNSPGGFSEWSYADNVPSPNLFLNTIFGVYHDIDPSKGGQIGWELITLNTGCRALVASWSDIPMFSTTCNSLLYTGMIVLYENTNVVEVYVKEKNVCASWNDGNGTIGMQNGDGTQGIVAPNRNGLDANWTVSSGSSEAWRFVPSGASIATIKWYEGSGTTGPVVGTTSVINVCPAATTTYTAEVTYSLCGGTSVLTETDTTLVTVNGSKAWNGSISSDWNTVGNWTPAALPNATDCVIIPVTAHNPIVSEAVVGVPYNALAGTLKVMNGASLTIATGNNITITDWVNVEATGTLTVENNANLVQVTNVSSNNNTGNIIYQRNASIRSLDYVYWSSPVAGFNVSSIASPLSFGAIYKWNTTIANTNGGWGNWQWAGGSTMLPGIGYIANGPSSFSTTVAASLFGSFSGVPNNGIITVPIYRGSDQNTSYHSGSNGTEITNFSDNWNLLGNPYPSSIRGSQFLFDNNTKIEGQLRLWTHGTLPAVITSPFYGTFIYNYSPGDYLTYNFTGTSCCPAANADLFVGAGQGFFVIMKDGAAGSDTVTFNNTLRSASYTNSTFYKNANATTSYNPVNSLERHRIWLDLIDSTNQSNRTLVGYIEGATMGRDSFYDAATSDTGSMAIYSMLNNDKFIIQGRSLPFNPNDVVPLGVTITTAGKYTIAIAAVDGLFENHNRNIYLEDRQTGVIQNLRDAPYSFDAPIGTNTTRFLLRYKYARSNGHHQDSKQLTNDVVITGFGKRIAIESSEEHINEMQVFDILGRSLYYAKNIDSTVYTTSEMNISQQTLIVKVTLESGQIISKKIIL